MKKIAFLVFAFVMSLSLMMVHLATDAELLDEAVIEATPINDDVEDRGREDTSEGEMDQASQEIIGTMTKKEERIQTLSEKYNNKTLGTVAYGLEVVRFYSTPIFFIFLVIGAFNFFIVGNKKLDKKEQGFGWITACVVGWVFFQCLPLIFALFTIGARK